MRASFESRTGRPRGASGRALIAAICWALLSMAGAARDAEGKPKLGEAEGEFRPVVADAVVRAQLSGALTAAERDYLGLGAAGPFTLAAVRADLVVVEFFNASCYACALMAPVMDEAWREVMARADLKDRVRFLGIGVGNTTNQVREFRERYDSPFPMIPDPEFVAFDAMGTVEGTPYLLLLRRGQGVTFARAQVGYIPESDRVVAEIAAALADEPPVDATPRDLAGQGWRTLHPPLTAEELQARVVAAAAGAGLANAKATQVRLPGGEVFFRVASGEKVLWASVAGRAKVCNVCHDIFFIVLFDGGGRVVDLAPITLTKYKNVEFDEQDVAFLRSRIVGRLLSRDIVFDPDVDAVTAATMTSALVFDTLRRLGDAWDAMVKAGEAQP